MKRFTDKQLTKKLDAAVRELMHLTAPHQCFVCKRCTEWFHPLNNPFGLQVGHYISRSVFALRWDMNNCQQVCSSCNRIHEENILPHTKAIIDTYGQKRIDYLNDVWLESKKKTKTFTYGEKLEMLEAFEEKIKSLKDE